MMASFSIGMRMALAIKPGESFETAISDSATSLRGIPFLHARPYALARSMVSSDVWMAGMISHSFLPISFV